MFSQIKKFLTAEYGLTANSLETPDENTAASRVYIADVAALGKVVVKESAWYSGFAADPFNTLEKVYEVAQV